jgi:hypothetical protein
LGKTVRRATYYEHRVSEFSGTKPDRLPGLKRQTPAAAFGGANAFEV